MSVAKLFLERVESLGLLDEKVLGQLRKQVADAKGPVSAETLAKVLVDNGHLTVFQAKKLVGDVTAAVEEARAKAAAKPPSASPSPAPKTPLKPQHDELSLADEEDGLELLEELPETPTGPPGVLGTGDLELLDDSDGLELLEDDPPAKPIAPVKAAPRPSATPASKAPAAAKASPPASTKAASTPASASKPGATKPAAPGASAQKSSGKAPASKPKVTSAAKPPPPASVSDELTPLGAGDLEVLEEGLTPLDDALGGDALFGETEAASPLAAPKKSSGLASGGKPRHGNQWDSALLYVGGGGLLVLVFAFVVLYFSLSRGSANEAFQLAEDDFKAQAFEQAINKYEHYLSRYGDSDSNASLARVRVGVAQIRMAVDNGKDTVESLAVTKEAIDRIESEESFNEARAELADILPNIAEKLALQAKRSTADLAKAAVLVRQADDALDLVNNSSYIPPALRQSVEPKVAAIQEDIALVKREINQDKELQAAVEAMNAATAAGNTTAATELRRAFLRKYPGLDLNDQVVAATLAIANKEQELVSVTQETLAPIAPVESELVELALVDRSVAAAEGSTQIVTMTLGGSVYGIDSNSGSIRWRRYLGAESVTQPILVANDAGADVLVIDKRNNDLLRVQNSDGSIVWRLPVGETFAAPTIVGSKALVSTVAGTILEVDLDTGESVRRARLPQGAIQSAAFDERRPHVYQLGEHSNLFVLSSETLECREVYFLGHLPGGIATRPVATGGQLFVCMNVGADYSFVHILSADAEGRNLEKKRDPVRLKGRVVSSPIVDGRRVYVFTDLGAAQVFDVDPANVSAPVTELARLIGTRKEPLVSYATVSDGRVWVCDDRMTHYELQPARQEMTRKWSRFDGEIFLAPPTRVADALVVGRLRRNVGNIAISAVGQSDGASQWRTSIAAPVRTITEAGNALLAINANASVFSLSTNTSAIVEASARLATAAEPSPFAVAWSVDDKVLLAPQSGDAQWALVAAAMNPLRTALIKHGAGTAQVTAQPIAFKDGILLPLDDGQVALANVLSGKPALLPFQPKLVPGELPRWQMPLALQGIDATFAIADDRGHLYLGAYKAEPQPHLAVAKEVDAGSIQSPLAQLDDAIVAVIEKEGQYLLQPFGLPDLLPREPLPLSSGVAYGPRGVSDGILLATDRDGLMMLESDLKTRWQVPLDGAGVVGIQTLADSLLVVTSQGDVLRIDSAGQVAQRFASQRPLAGDPTVVGKTLWCPGADGAVYGIALSSLEK